MDRIDHESEDASQFADEYCEIMLDNTICDRLNDNESVERVKKSKP